MLKFRLPRDPPCCTARSCPVGIAPGDLVSVNLRCRHVQRKYPYTIRPRLRGRPVPGLDATWRPGHGGGPHVEQRQRRLDCRHQLDAGRSAGCGRRGGDQRGQSAAQLGHDDPRPEPGRRHALGHRHPDRDGTLELDRRYAHRHRDNAVQWHAGHQRRWHQVDHRRSHRERWQYHHLVGQYRE